MAEKERQREKDIMVDMCEFIVTYAATILDPAENVSQQVYEAAKDDLKKLDTLFRDNGFGRTNKFYDIGEGFLRDYRNLEGDEAQSEADRLAQDAIDYLGKHVDYFETWRTE